MWGVYVYYFFFSLIYFRSVIESIRVFRIEVIYYCFIVDIDIKNKDLK